MPRQTRNIGGEASPHFDGKRDTVTNDPTGVQMGVRADVNSQKNPYHVNKLKNDEKETPDNNSNDKY
ncbi:hypothetical protein [Lentibacillus sp. Marseille-P4043]|uniref:hypothetical protein n=1 Tax=Lentibacillus sp. Marseille-P4043 TaxID=2040293 RepID=UPI000D0B1EC9|nr:hypothetical protein [Lentibacillus sp. Marseille-P4043]